MTKNLEFPSSTKLDMVSANYFAIPESIILDTDIDKKRAITFAYFATRRGIGGELLFSVNNIIKWAGKTPDRHANGANDKIVQIIESLKSTGYLKLLGKLDSYSYTEAIFDFQKVLQECEYDRFAIIYLDELKKILGYKNVRAGDSSVNNATVFLVFAYLRMMIYRRQNKLRPEEINLDNKNSHEYDIEARRLRSPEAYNCHYCEIAEFLGLSARIVSKAVSVLNELGLIYSEALPRIQRDGKWWTDHTVFSNAYKREGGYLLASGESYYLTEIENKKKKLRDTRRNQGKV